MNEPPADWYLARLLDSAALHLDQLLRLDPMGASAPLTQDLIVRLRDAADELRRLDVR